MNQKVDIDSTRQYLNKTSNHIVVKNLKIKIANWNESSLFKMTFFSEAINRDNINEKENK